jgi:hypothetical protein
LERSIVEFSLNWSPKTLAFSAGDETTVPLLQQRGGKEDRQKLFETSVNRDQKALSEKDEARSLHLLLIKALFVLRKVDLHLLRAVIY